MNADPLRELLKFAVQQGDITAADARKIEAYTRKKKGDVRVALGVMQKHHGVSADRCAWLLHGQSQMGAHTMPMSPSEMGFSDEAPAHTPGSSYGAGSSASGSGSRPSRSSGTYSSGLGYGQTQAPAKDQRKTVKLKPVQDTTPPIPAIGGCDLKSLLGKGAMGAVYRGYHKGFDQEMAVKLLPPERTEKKRFVELFLKEARSLVRVNHENVVRVFNVGEENGQYFIAMELIEGSDLGDIIKKNKTISNKQAIHYLIEAAKGLGAAHKEGLVHRDVKPDNLMITTDDIVKVADFGLAVQAEADSGKGGFRKKSIVGTPYYMPPEQADGSPTDARADVYALGCTLYHAITGRVPFKGKTLMDIIVQHVNKEPSDPREFNPGIKPELVDVCLKMMAKEPEDRFQSMAELTETLEALEKGQAPKVKLPSAEEAVKIKKVLTLEERPLPKLPERPPVRGVAISSSAITVCVLVLLGLLNYPVVTALAVDPPTLAPQTTVLLEGLEKSLNLDVENAESFNQTYGIFASTHPKLVKKAQLIRDRILAKSKGKAAISPAEADKAFKELQDKLDDLKSDDQLINICILLFTFPESTKLALGKSAEKLIADQEAYSRRLADEKQLIFVPGNGEGIKPFFMMKTEVTCASYAAFLKADSKASKPEKWPARTCPTGMEKLPVTGVTYDSAVAYAKWSGQRLPSVEEWIWTARGPKSGPFPWGQYSATDVRRLNCRSSDKGKVLPVSSYGKGEFSGASPFGAVNIVGNAAEWVEAPESVKETQAYAMGGSFRAHIFSCQTTSKALLTRDTQRDDLGFRCVRDLSK